VYKIDLHSGSEKGISIEVINVKRKTLSDKKRTNNDEATVIRDLVKKQIINLGSFAILTPYKNQEALLKKLCFRFIGDAVMTIHVSQGREWDTVIFSVCDTTDKYFTDSNNVKSNGKLILNTAISRAKKKLIIVCDEDYWLKQEGQLIYDLIINKD
jgi:superfamily I DNA and/or RNA helicase